MKYLLIWLGISLFIFTNCTDITNIEHQPEYEIYLDGRLNKDDNGYYELKLNNYTNQTVHRLQGILEKDGGKIDRRKKIGWESSHKWVLGDTLGIEVRRFIEWKGIWITVDTVYVSGFSDMEVPTVNSVSITKEDGEFSGMIAPILPMKGDTMEVRTYYREGTVDVSTLIKIILK